MGTWGTAIFSDDLACDVREAYTNLIGEGKEKNATKSILKIFKNNLKDSDEEPVIWLSLASTQWKLGRLEDKIKEKAIEIIDTGIDLKRWEEEPKLLVKRKNVLDKLKEQLNSPQCLPKKVSNPNRPRVNHKLVDPSKISYPFEPKTNKFLVPGQFWAIPLENGKFACGRVIELNPDHNRSFLAGLMDWIGENPPSEEDLAGCKTLEQGCVHIKTIKETGLNGMITGCRPLILDGIESNYFTSCTYGGELMKGFKIIEPIVYAKDDEYETLSYWGYVSIKIRAEYLFKNK
ncbi:MAG TPA: Imm26 family immunity protein [Pseudobacteroides sp.]|uniref:Imm26 family immunity protein n=1 Tax=Pseudobacteroides sp. TaxID=1968840 RepID=UPI002F9221E5